MIRGTDVTLYAETQTGTDDFGRPIVETTPVTVSNVIICPSSSTDILATTQLYGKKAVYQLLLPKGDAHDWIDKKVSFTVANVNFEGLTFGLPDAYIDGLVPLDWNQRVWVAEYE